MAHTCHALGCTRHCRPEHLMCARHWRMVPLAEAAQVYWHYRPGQCDDMRFSREWHLAATEAINAVALKEGRLTQEEAEQRLSRVAALYDLVKPEKRRE